MSVAIGKPRLEVRGARGLEDKPESRCRYRGPGSVRQTRDWLAYPPPRRCWRLLRTVGQQVRHCSGNVRRPRTERCYSWIVRRPRTERGCSWIVAVRVRNVRVIAVAGLFLLVPIVTAVLQWAGPLKLVFACVPIVTAVAGEQSD